MANLSQLLESLIRLKGLEILLSQVELAVKLNKANRINMKIRKCIHIGIIKYWQV